VSSSAMKHKKLKRKKKHGNTCRILRLPIRLPTLCDSGRDNQDPIIINSDTSKADDVQSENNDGRGSSKGTAKGKHYCIEGESGDSLTCNYWERGNKVSGEQRLWYSVLAITLRDYRRGCEVAWSWIWDEGHEVGGYLWVCEVLGICGTRIRARVRAGSMIDINSSTTITWTLRANSLPQSVDIERRRRKRRG